MSTVSRTSRLSLASSVILVSALAVTLASPVVAGQIDITAKAINPSLLVGEPLVLSVKVRADVPVVFPTHLMSPGLPFRVLIDRGSNYVPYVEYVLSPAPEDEAAGRLPAGITRELLLGYDAVTLDWTFPAPGTYRLVVEYQPAAGSPVRSNVVTVTVASPTGAEKEVHDGLRQIGPQLVVPHEIARLEPWLEPFVRDHPQSVYLQGRRLRDLEGAMQDVGSGYEPGHVPQAGTPDYPPPGPDMRPETVQARLHDLLPTAVELGEIAGPYQPDALLKLGELYYGVGELDRGREVFERVVREFPEREAARIARGALGDRTPPTLRLAASPATLWPPNNKFVTVTVAVTVSDDLDPTPAVTLVSITCDDACNTAQDVAGASFGSDDRSFELRAQRRGTGAGRTYTIAYDAKDASGNSAPVKVAVRVPHDQR